LLNISNQNTNKTPQGVTDYSLQCELAGMEHKPLRTGQCPVRCQARTINQ